MSNVDILSTIDRPYEGVTSYSTIGLSDYSIGYSIDEKPLRVEIVGASATMFELFPNVLSTCAFNIINTKLPIIHDGTCIIYFTFFMGKTYLPRLYR